MKLVLFLNMGGATNLKDCKTFLKNMFNDPYILGIKNRFLRQFVAWMITLSRTKAMQQNYIKMGGKSPLNEITYKLCHQLNSLQKEFKFDFINLYVPPYANEVLKKYSLNSKDEIILYPLYPHHSCTTVTSSLDVLQREIEKLNITSKIKIMDIFYKNTIYNQMIISHILDKKNHFNAKTLIFSAHSLPVSLIKKGDLYEKHINEHVQILKEKLKNHFEEIILSYQSKLGPIKWLEPSTSDILSKLKNKALIYPISFCIDCSETIFELGIEYRDLASQDYALISCPNHSDEFIDFILKSLKN
ncbi:ferrochelatase [Campylobacter sp. LH-2024]|uniref:Ferrochelatase n=1 Tax=Campylobacter molothri TaxID=1032242 RepID=A0ACC5W225_9BACT|nr:ferrochelatase [Campylobacter sp. RM10542]MBZ7930980.1 ferrochelatase [Campylobacter sp. RM12910]MBZ7932486.1 ferrochelatase [Campylobacter sp. RM10543]MBZ7937981.1 ferrochelatase [Campylobacter sp. RM10538]MBZ7940377.1 ferrochelatase [Campylobacter sp. W0047]MBZ7942704.1 ferrochelatase [Campylobacter sp. W0045]MBZ7944273.1 ferrochelatase [Campylobacter sp. RM13744]MBZ7958336.1 ferrochelatase [Campylobacter sp. RM9760]MBZ7959107.1 ferrochelatase [Campylobacter sp. RM12397]MBZ7961775.1 f